MFDPAADGSLTLSVTATAFAVAIPVDDDPAPFRLYCFDEHLGSVAEHVTEWEPWSDQPYSVHAAMLALMFKLRWMRRDPIPSLWHSWAITHQQRLLELQGQLLKHVVDQ